MPWKSSPRICGICSLPPPIRNQRVLALDPGYKSGCKFAALDQFGNLLEHGVIFLIGRRIPAARFGFHPTKPDCRECLLRGSARKARGGFRNCP